MTTLTRARHAPWGDLRFYIGIALVLLSVVGVWSIVASARTTTAVLQADRTLVPGEALSSADFVITEVSLGAAAEHYLAPQDLVPGMVAARSVEAGELLSSAAVGDVAESRTTTIVVESSLGLPADVTTGSVVELWHAPPLDDGFDAPRILLADAVVAALVSDEGMLAQSTPAVELVIDRSDVADVLAAITGGSTLWLVPVGAAG